LFIATAKRIKCLKATLVLPTSPDQLLPGQHVAVFPREDASGATLGYFGTIVALRRRTFTIPPHDPDAWIYSVVTHPIGRYDVTASQFLVDLVGGWEVEFDRNRGDESAAITGRYCVGRRNWAGFRFERGAVPVSRYELRLPAIPVTCQTPSLFYEVPLAVELNRDFVRRTLEELFGPPSPAEHP
jgi:hypothetical protein